MAADKRDDDGRGRGFLSRWSERKQAAEAGRPPEEPPQPDAGKAGNLTAREAASPAEAERIDPADLPDIDSLEAGADFTVFLRKGVPGALRRRALRRLWQVDPAFGEICMLDDYNLDYTDAATVVPNLKTLYQVGRGMVMGDEEAAKAEEERQPELTPEAPETAAVAPEDEEGPEAAAEASQDAPEAVPSAEVPRERPKPGTPRVKAGPTPRSAAARPVAGSAPRSARQRRWGDPEGK